MTRCCIPSASTLLQKSKTLNPTTTIVRDLPIVAEGWEIAALGGDTFTSLEMEDTSANKASLAKLERDLTAAKAILKPTLTNVRHSVTVTTSQQQPTREVADYVPHVLDFLKPQHGWSEAHGFLGNSSWQLPHKVVHCDVEARPGYATKMAHEYQDTPTVLQAKVDMLAHLIDRSKHCLVYSGAGISTNSGISDYATRTKQTTLSANKDRLMSPYEAQPTFTHRALVALHEAGLVNYWVQQNHDGLPQKAGLPQSAINEIHGAWYDPSNPVVAMNGSLRSDLFKEMLAWEEKADLTLSMGTSMCGMNSDRVFTSVARKAKKAYVHMNKKYKKFLGGVIINKQQTQHDHLSCLRIFADIDEVMSMLLIALGMKDGVTECLKVMEEKDSRKPFSRIAKLVKALKDPKDPEDVFRVPYKSDGTRRNGLGICRILDLRPGSKLRITEGPYEGDHGEVLGKNLEGHYRIQFRHLFGITKRPYESVLGSWWAVAALAGEVERIPVVNIK